MLVFSLEMGHARADPAHPVERGARSTRTKLRTGRLAETDWTKIGKAIGRLEVPLFLDDNPRVTVMEIRAKARRMKARYGGLALIVIDYLQLMSGSGNSENRQLEVSEISRGLKILARELEVPIVALSQLSRNLEARADKRPMLADLRESGSLEQDADVVMFLYRDEVYNPESPDKGSAEVIVAKHRSGPIGTKRLVFLGQYTRVRQRRPQRLTMSADQRVFTGLHVPTSIPTCPRLRCMSQSSTLSDRGYAVGAGKRLRLIERADPRKKWR